MSRTKHEYTYEDRLRDDKIKEAQDKKRDDRYQMYKFGTITYSRDSRNAKYEKITAVPVEIEVPDELNQLVKIDILQELEISYSEWVERCYRERMKQILTDPAEFGKVLLDDIRRSHCFQEWTMEDF